MASMGGKTRIGNEAGAAYSLGELGKLYRDAGMMREAIAALQETLDIDQRMGNPVQVGIDLEFLGSIHERQGQLEAALEKYEEALALKRKYMPPQSQAITERNIARVRGKMGGR